ncbi:MAG TPA: thiamine pyrophosphate-dependent enzyme [Balneolales bacterium]|nr:thiamine pyrophosphate-dependent enzyme [Balneolales bacterium]
MENLQTPKTKEKLMANHLDKEEVIEDYRLAVMSREASILGRKETLTGKAKFGIFGDGKEIPQIAMAKFFKEGDFRSGYYRDQTFMMAIGELTIQEFFAELYAHADVEAEPNSGGRQMNCHFATRSLNDDGSWKDLTKMKNSSADISPTAGQMARLLGLAHASKVYREVEELHDQVKFSNNGNEVAFGTIGDASTSEGIFWETVNAAGVLQVPMVLSVWDDGYGISVPKKYQTTKGSISSALRGFKRTQKQQGYEIFTVKAWDYEGLVETYKNAVEIARNEHVPVLVHVQEVTQPQGHSTSGSHERYKSKERLEWEKEHCCNLKMREYILKNDIATEEELDQLEDEARKYVIQEKNKEWKAFRAAIDKEKNEVLAIFQKMESQSNNGDDIAKIIKSLKTAMDPIRKDIIIAVRRALLATAGQKFNARDELLYWLSEANDANKDRYDSQVVSESEWSPLKIKEIKPKYDDNPKKVDGRVVLRDNFDVLFDRNPSLLVFGEDSGKLGDVNLGLEGLQEKYGKLRVSDTGIRESSIIGQGIGMAVRGLRPIAEIQYLDYLLYGFQTISDDLATLHYRTKGGQKAPMIVRTRGHRLEGIWHSGSSLGLIINGVRGIHVCVPRNLTQAAGFYNTIIRGDDPALIIEPLNAYRVKEYMPTNLGDFTVPLGVPEVVEEGNDITVVSYGSTFNIITSVMEDFKRAGISVELIDVRTLLPFDRNHIIVESLKKTNRILFVDEDMPGATTAYMMQKVINEQGGFYYLDSEPKTLTSKEHRPAYGSDGDYFSKPNAEDIFEAVYDIMREANPQRLPAIY